MIVVCVIFVLSNLTLIQTCQDDVKPIRMTYSLFTTAYQNFEVIEDTVVRNLEGRNCVSIDLQSNRELCNKMFDLSNFTQLTIMGDITATIEQHFLENSDLDCLDSLIIRGTQISTIRTHTFRNLSVETIGMSANDLKIIEKEAFLDLPKLKEVDLSVNKITNLRTDFFARVPNLAQLDMGRNLVAILRKKSLDFLRENPAKEVDLNLEKNCIEVLEVGVFDGLTFSRVWLVDNLIRDLSDEFLYGCFSIESIGFADNPLSVKARQKLSLWLLRHNITADVPDFVDVKKSNLVLIAIMTFLVCLEFQ